jgi:hypothetical protein
LSIAVGFVLVTHNSVAQTALLCRRLNTMFNHPPIAVHHDFGQTAMSASALPQNVHVVQDWIATTWAGIGVVDANLKALQLLYERSNPDWVISLSNACYPIKTAEQIAAVLEATHVDAFIDHNLITFDRVSECVERDDLDRYTRWHIDVFQRYIAVPVPSRIVRLLDLQGQRRYIKRPWATSILTPFRNGFRCYAGSAWYAVSRFAAQVLLRKTPAARKLRIHYRNRFCPDESYYQTILVNNNSLKVVNKCFTYADWSFGGSHPKTLCYDDIPKLLSSPALFARKFPADEGLLRALDAAIAEQM